MDRARGRLREDRQHARALAHREVGALAELLHEAVQEARRRCQQARLARARGEHEDLPADAVGERVGVALDEAVLGERGERARDLALVAADELGQAHDAEPAAARGLRPRERLQYGEAALETGGAGVHARTLAQVATGVV